MSLSDSAIKNAKPQPDKDYKLPDEKGMYLLVHKNGSKYFRFDYRFNEKRKTLALGVYPDTSLKQAREKRDTARKQIADGIDPCENKKAVKESRAESIANSFEVVAREWGAKEGQQTHWESNNKRLLEINIFPWLGSKPITDILPKDILSCIKRVEDRGCTNTAYRVLRVCGQVFRYGVATLRVDRDISADLRGSLSKKEGKNFAAITEPQKVGALLRAIDAYRGGFQVICALKLAPMLFVRPGELRQAEWEYIDLDAKEWRYFVTKTKKDHIVPLSRQAIEILTELKPLTGNGRYVFPNTRSESKPMPSFTLLAALRRSGFESEEMTIHGFRAMARTILDEVLGFRPDFIEHQLAHAIRDANGRSYNRTSHLPERHKMMQAWADYLDGLKNGGASVSI